MSRLRRYQRNLVDRTFSAWNAAKDVAMGVLPCGGGKTVVVAAIFKEANEPGGAIAHRQELVSQISLALAREEIKHDIIAPDNVRKRIVAMHMQKYGKPWYDPSAKNWVAGVDTLMARKDRLDPQWCKKQQVIAPDEAHHVLRENKWGQSYALFPNAYGFFPTATPERADGKGLGRAADGYVDALIEGPKMRQMIDSGFLTDYEVITATVDDLDMSDVKVGATGDWSAPSVSRAVHRSRKMVGNVVDAYLEHTPGQKGVVFAVDVEEAAKIAAEFNARGVPAELVTAESTDEERAAAIRKLESGQLKILTNVDLFGEGFDLPAITVVIMARPTLSYSLYAQQFGRVLRLLISAILMGAWDTYTDAQRLALIAESEKPFGTVIDMVGNIYTHGGPPDRPREWNMDGREKGRRAGPSDAIPMRTCMGEGCWLPYEKFLDRCPYCGEPAPEPAQRSSLQAVDGNLFKLSPEVLAQMRGEIVDPMAPTHAAYGMSGPARASLFRKDAERKAAHHHLREALAWWSGHNSHLSEGEQHKLFYLRFGMGVLDALALSGPDAERLTVRVNSEINR